jgi:hypothetical protein
VRVVVESIVMNERDEAQRERRVTARGEIMWVGCAVAERVPASPRIPPPPAKAGGRVADGRAGQWAEGG